MILPIITYPTPIGIEYAPDVRSFDEELFTFLDNLKETAFSASLDALSGAQVGSYYNVVVYKENEVFKELINPRIIKREQEIQVTEYTSYFPNISADMKRYKSITLIYEDRKGEQHSMKVENDLSVTLQRKIDYLYGANFLVLLKGKEREEFESRLEVKEPTTNRFVQISNSIMIGMIILLFSSLFIDINLWSYQFYASWSVVGINIFSILYLRYTSKGWLDLTAYSAMAIDMFRVSVIMMTSWFVL